MLRKLEDLIPVDWIKENTDVPELRPEMWRGNFVSHCVPKIYPAYCKILHPIYEDLSVADRGVSWDDVKVLRVDEGDPIDNLLNESTTIYAGPDEASTLRRISWKQLAGQLGLTFHPEINVDTFTSNFAGRSWPRYLIGPDEGNLNWKCAARSCGAFRLSPRTGRRAFFDTI